MISYDPLLDFLHFSKRNIHDVVKDVGISSRTAAKFRKGESVSLATVERICLHYGLSIEEVVTIMPESESDDKRV